MRNQGVATVDNVLQVVDKRLTEITVKTNQPCQKMFELTAPAWERAIVALRWGRWAPR